MRRLLLLTLALFPLWSPLSASAQSNQIDAIVLVDTSASMVDEVDALCESLDATLDAIRAARLMARVRIIGITEEYRCVGEAAQSLIANSAVADDEDWGIALVELSERYPWQAGAVRLIMPLSDAGPASGNPVDDPGPDRDITTRVSRAAVANKVIVSPILAGPAPDISKPDRARLEVLAQELASRTGGRVFASRSPSDVAIAIQQLIAASLEVKAGLTAIAAAIPTPDRISLDPGILMTNAILAALVAALFTLTTLLSGETFKATRPQLPANRVTNAIGSAVDRFRKTVRIIATPTAWPLGNASVRRAVTAVVLTAFLALTALVAAFLDPNFQPNTPSGVITFVTLFVALALVNLAAAFGGALSARSKQATPGLRVRPCAILLAAACVVISRNIGFLPGCLIGLPAGLALLNAEANLDRDAAVGRASILAAMLAGAAAWLLSWPFSALSANLSATVTSGATSIALSVVGGVQSALLTIFLIALQFALFDLMPLGATAGRKWFAQRKLIWMVAFGVVAFAALHTLFNPNRSGLDALRNPGLLPLGATMALYSGVTLIAWLLTNESRLRDPQNLNRRSALTAGALMVTWLGGIACIALAEIASTFSPVTVLAIAAVLAASGLGAWVWMRRRSASPPPREGRPTGDGTP